MILTHPHADHVTGLIQVLRRYKVDEVVMSSAVHTTPEYIAFLKEVRAARITSTDVNHPFVWRGEDNHIPWQWQFIYPDRKLPATISDLNAVSVVSRLTFGQQTFIFMGDATKEVEELLMAEGRALRANVLKVGHHGSAGSSGENFLRAVQPKYAVISAGVDNRFGHPAPLTLNHLTKSGAAVYRTDERGWIQFETNGTDLVVMTEK